MRRLNVLLCLLALPALADFRISPKPGGGGGGGTVTSVALTAPTIFTVSGSPITTSGTLALSLNPQAANTVFAGPTSGAAAVPTFRALVAADIPDLALTYLKLDTSNDPLTNPLEIEHSTSSTTTNFLTLHNTNNSMGLGIVIEGSGVAPSANFVNQSGTILFRTRLDVPVFQVGDASGLITSGVLNVAWTSPASRGIYLEPPAGQFQDLIQVSGGVFALDDDGDLRIIKSVSYDWPSSNALGVLSNDGSGNLTWSNSLQTQINDRLKLDTTNGPLTGNLGITKSTPEFRLTDSGNSEYSRVTRNASNVTNYQSRVMAAGAAHALDFDSTADKLEITTPNPLLSGTGDFTITAWVKPSALVTGYIAGNYGASPGLGGIEFYLSGLGFVRLYLGSMVSSTSTYVVGDWNFVAVRRSSGSIRFYVNGVFEPVAGTLSASISSPLNWTVGNGPNYTTERFQGSIDQVSVWNTALSHAELDAIYNAGNGALITPTPNTLLLWEMTEGTGTSVADTSGNARHGTAISTSWVTGKVVGTGTMGEVSYLKVENGTLVSSDSKITFGSTNSENIFSGIRHNFNIAGTQALRLTGGSGVFIDTLISNLFIRNNTGSGSVNIGASTSGDSFRVSSNRFVSISDNVSAYTPFAMLDIRNNSTSLDSGRTILNLLHANGSSSYSQIIFTHSAALTSGTFGDIYRFSSTYTTVARRNQLWIRNTGSDIVLSTDTASTAEDFKVTSTGAMLATSRSSSIVPITVRGASSQSANLLEIQNSSGSVLANVTALGGAVFNEQGNDADFRIEGDTDVNNFFSDASADSVQIGAATTVESNKFYVEGRAGVKAGSATGKSAKIGGVIKIDTSNVGNVGAGEDTLHSYTLPASTLASDGDVIEYSAYGTGSATVSTIKFYLGASVLLNTLLSGAVAKDWTLNVKIYRTGASAQKYVATLHNDADTLPVIVTGTASESLSSSLVLKVTGEGVADDDIVQRASQIEWKPVN